MSVAERPGATAPVAVPGAGERPRLDALTSLRFFAALMIVAFHARGLFGFEQAPVYLAQGVTFFFVLSGFILAYVYPRLDTARELRGFWRARVARIWPAHLATLALGAVLVGYPWTWATGAANVLLLHAWIPLSAFYFGYNAVSWSISTELFFYLAFPWLARRWDATGRWKLLGAALLVVALGVACAAWGLAEQFPPNDPVGGYAVTRDGLMFMHPLGRLLEFTLGIAIAKAWEQRGARPLPGNATAWELGAVAVCVGWMFALPRIAEASQAWLHPIVDDWLEHSGALPAFVALIFVVAPGRGALSRALSAPWLVLLGETSYSLYLVHQILLGTYRLHQASFPPMPDAMAAALMLAVLLLASYLLWRVVELPARRWLLGRREPHAATPPTQFGLSRRALVLAALGLFEVLAALRYGGALPIAVADPIADVAGARFGEATTLREVRLECTVGGLAVHLDWARPVGAAKPPRYAVQLVAPTGVIVQAFDYAGVDGGGHDTIHVPQSALHGAQAIGLGLYDPTSGRLSPVDRGRRDHDGRRLLLDLPACATP
jgi:peptidoglycan/LPS O-acetylase OafA/YrhL